CHLAVPLKSTVAERELASFHDAPNTPSTPGHIHDVRPPVAQLAGATPRTGSLAIDSLRSSV
ncbi:MAG: hypothetical protein M3R02_08850, partial [Chloroflexota bacterium]|nr:hypothetical protein [Chloroflexota bacterium]